MSSATDKIPRELDLVYDAEDMRQNGSFDIGIVLTARYVEAPTGRWIMSILWFTDTENYIEDRCWADWVDILSRKRR